MADDSTAQAPVQVPEYARLALATRKEGEDYTVGLWGGIPNYQCNTCLFETLNPGTLETHLQAGHPYLAPGVTKHTLHKLERIGTVPRMEQDAAFEVDRARIVVAQPQTQEPVKETEKEPDKGAEKETPPAAPPVKPSTPVNPSPVPPQSGAPKE